MKQLTQRTAFCSRIQCYLRREGTTTPSYTLAGINLQKVQHKCQYTNNNKTEAMEISTTSSLLNIQINYEGESDFRVQMSRQRMFTENGSFDREIEVRC